MSTPTPESRERRIWPASTPGPSSERWHRASLGLKRIMRRLSRTGVVRTDDGVRYRPVGGHSITRALSRRGPGYKEFDVSFPCEEPMRIRAEAGRVFADLTGPRFASERELLTPHVRPGSRVLIMNAGTGDMAAWLYDRVGPSGGVVAIEEDEQSIAFAQRRYPGEAITFERGGVNQIAGEPDEAFEFVLLPRSFDPGDSRVPIAPFWRLVAPGGALAISTASGSVLASSLNKRLSDVSGGSAVTSIIERAGISLAIAARPI